MPGFPVQNQLLMLVQTHVHRVGDAIQPSHPLSSPSPPASILLSIRVFPNNSVLCIKWPKYWSFNFSISPSNEYSLLNFFRIDWFDLLQSKELSRVFSNTPFKSINSLALSFLSGPSFTSILTTGKTVALAIETFVGKVMSYIYIYIYIYICIYLHFPETLSNNITAFLNHFLSLLPQ